MSIADLRDGIATNLRTISGLRASETIPDNFSPPIAVISLTNVLYNEAFAKGLTQYNFIVSVIVGRVAEREAQRRLDTYTSNGSASVKSAIESDRTLGSAAYDVRVTEMTNIGTVLLGGDVTYLSADFAVSVYAE